MSHTEPRGKHTLVLTHDEFVLLDGLVEFGLATLVPPLNPLFLDEVERDRMMRYYVEQGRLKVGSPAAEVVDGLTRAMVDTGSRDLPQPEPYDSDQIVDPQL